jgi:hypothetical protein
MNQKANFTRASSPQKEQRHGPSVPLYELGLPGSTKRYDAVPTGDVRHDTAVIKKQYMDAQQQRTIDAAVGEVMAALRDLEARLDALEARREKARQDEALEALRARLSRPVKAYELDETASILRRHPLFGDQP